MLARQLLNLNMAGVCALCKDEPILKDPSLNLCFNSVLSFNQLLGWMFLQYYQISVLKYFLNLG